jgi:polysaccharide export outer membrane protein
MMGTPATALRFAILFGAAATLAACDSTYSGAIQNSDASSGRVAGAGGAEHQLAQKVGADISASSPGSTTYQIGVQDVLEIVVFKVPELTRSVQVADSGSINLPLIGEVPAAGLTSQEVERELAKRLGASYLKNPQVNIYVKEYNSQRVTIEGSVRSPGVFPIRGRMTLMQALASSGGPDRDYASSDIMVFRQIDGRRTGLEYNIDAIRTGEALDPPLHSNDVVVVPTSNAKFAFQSFLKIVPAAAALKPPGVP